MANQWPTAKLQHQNQPRSAPLEEGVDRALPRESSNVPHHHLLMSRPVAPIYLEAGQARVGHPREGVGELLQHREALLRLDVDFPKRLKTRLARQVGQPRPYS
jgi:hypothetical protein